MCLSDRYEFGKNAFCDTWWAFEPIIPLYICTSHRRSYPGPLKFALIMNQPLSSSNGYK